MRTFIAFLTVAALAAPAADTARSTAGVTLVADVGAHDGFTITLTFTNGKRVRTLRAGTYTFIVHDRSALHNFALGSRTANKRLFTTGIPFVGTKTYRLHLARGSYAYACSAHFQTMNGAFSVT
jgi:plastocyanin